MSSQQEKSRSLTVIGAIEELGPKNFFNVIEVLETRAVLRASIMGTPHEKIEIVGEVIKVTFPNGEIKELIMIGKKGRDGRVDLRETIFFHWREKG